MAPCKVKRSAGEEEMIINFPKDLYLKNSSSFWYTPFLNKTKLSQMCALLKNLLETQTFQM